MLLAAGAVQADSLILYSRHDTEAMQRQRAELILAGETVHVDRDLEPGALWRVEIARLMCDGPVRTVWVLWSKNAEASLELAAEWRVALACAARVVPVLLDDTPMPAELGARHGLDRRP